MFDKLPNLSDLQVGMPLKAEHMRAIVTALMKNITVSAPLELTYGPEGILISLGRSIPLPLQRMRVYGGDYDGDDDTGLAKVLRWNGSDFAEVGSEQEFVKVHTGDFVFEEGEDFWAVWLSDVGQWVAILTGSGEGGCPEDPGEDIVDLTVEDEGEEEPNEETWEACTPDPDFEPSEGETEDDAPLLGCKVRVASRPAVYDDTAGTPILYGFYRDWTLTHDGRVFAISAETRYVIDEPEECE